MVSPNQVVSREELEKHCESLRLDLRLLEHDVEGFVSRQRKGRQERLRDLLLVPSETTGSSRADREFLAQSMVVSLKLQLSSELEHCEILLANSE